MNLLIVESPTKARTIAKFLPKEYEVESSMGHIRDLPKNKYGVDVENGFVPEYIIPPKKKQKVSELKKKALKADEIILATDPDREGEAIAWHLIEALELSDAKNKKGKSVKRIVFHEITKDAVEEAISNPRGINNNLVKAQEARRILDRIFGYDLSKLIWKKVRYGLSAGRVQSPALRLIVEREREISAFIPEDYYVIKAILNGCEFVCTEEPKNKTEAEKIISAGENESWRITSVKESKRLRNPLAPFKTSTLQQAASSRFGFTPSRTMRVAQKLYEAGLITYMRTDSISISSSAQAQAIAEIESKYGKEYIEARNFKTKSKTAQEAHEAIRPTNIKKVSAGSDVEQKKLYELIRKQTIAGQMKSAELMVTRVLAKAGEGKIPEFALSGSRTIFDGWLKAFPEARGEDKEIPGFKENDALKLKEMILEEKQTQPPNRYSEAGLVKELEKRGIGRPSTYASIIRTLEDRGYIVKENKSLKPTDTGEVVSRFLEDNFEKYISDSFTANLEDGLDEMADGRKDYKQTLADFYEPFIKEIESKENIPKITTLGDAPEKYPCPECGAPMVYKLGKSGIFMSCSKFPECKGLRNRDGEIAEPNKPIGKHSETGEDIYVLQGPYGPYVQLGEKTEKNKKPKRASIPKDKIPADVTVENAVKYLSLPRLLGEHPDTGKNITANVGRFGPYIVHEGDFRSLKGEDNVYDIKLERALEILKEPKKRRGGRKSKK